MQKMPSLSVSLVKSISLIAIGAIGVAIGFMACSPQGPVAVKSLSHDFKNKITINNATNLRVRITIRATGATFPGVVAADWLPAAPTITNVSPSVWDLDFAVNAPNNTFVKVRGTFTTPQIVQSLDEYRFSNVDEPVANLTFPGVAMVLAFESPNGLVLRVSNAGQTSLGNVVLQELEWTGSTIELSVDDLDYGNSNLEMLPWQATGVTLPITLTNGGAPQTFDVPDIKFFNRAGPYIYLRYKTTIPSFPSETLVEGVIQGNQRPLRYP